ncbi:hypothetical protein RND71_014464 [Anisodus tanguticus]|uniref:Uncharacterized protein n=1 Tax=Anisodus tanguticus TaxID=243964 RepID=A0AAE1S957_9SOLA|nr:hypothetical protein RND71_014464 [Anisodus tanguticus]
MSHDFHHRYYDNLLNKKLLPKKGIVIERVSKFLPDFNGRLETTRWTCFIASPCKANKEWLREFYVNLKRTGFDNPKLTIRGQTLKFGVKQINAFYNLPKHPPELVLEIG